MLSVACWLMVGAVLVPLALFAADYFYLNSFDNSQISDLSRWLTWGAATLLLLARPVRLGPLVLLLFFLGYLTSAPGMIYFPIYLVVWMPISLLMLAHEPSLQKIEDLRGIPSASGCLSFGCLGCLSSIMAAMFYGVDDTALTVIKLLNVLITLQILATMPVLAVNLWKNTTPEESEVVDIPPTMKEDAHEEDDWSHA